MNICTSKGILLG